MGSEDTVIVAEGCQYGRANRRTIKVILTVGALLMTAFLWMGASVKADVQNMSNTVSLRIDKIEERVEMNMRMIDRLDERGKATAEDIREIKESLNVIVDVMREY